MKPYTCIVCNSERFTSLFQKESESGEKFNLARCRNCGLEFIHPRPTEDDIKKYYSLNYFTQRTDRGYDNYFSDGIRSEIERVLRLNLRDLGFFEYDKTLSKKRVLDIGCAAGYFLNFMRNLGWESTGVDISEDCVDFAQNELNLDVTKADYLSINYQKKFQLITLWATLEHLHYPDKVIEKIYHDLDRGGFLYISTCRSGGINFKLLFGRRWRFYNFPEHLFFFSYKTLKKLLEHNGFTIVRYITYGSGLSRKLPLLRNAADLIAKKFSMGDMMLISAKKM